jgi:hypothetical protein
MRAILFAAMLTASAGCIELDLYECERDCYEPTLSVQLPQLSDPDPRAAAIAMGGVATLQVSGAIGDSSDSLEARGGRGVAVEWSGRTEVRVRMTSDTGDLHLASDEATKDTTLHARATASATLVPFEAAFLHDDDDTRGFVRFAGAAVPAIVRLTGDGMRLIDEDITLASSWAQVEQKAWDRFVLAPGGAGGIVTLGTQLGTADLAIPEVDTIDDIVPRIGEGLASPGDVHSRWKEPLFCFEALRNGKPVAGLVWRTSIGFGVRETEGCYQASTGPYTHTLTVEAGGLVREYTIRRE